MNRTEIEAKLNTVLKQMVSRCETPEDKSALKSAELFQNIGGLPIEIVGFSVPISAGTNRAHISFTLEHFRRTAPAVLAAQGLDDWRTAKAISRKPPKVN